MSHIAEVTDASRRSISNDRSKQIADIHRVCNNMQEVLEQQKAAHITSGPADYATRIDRLDRLEQLLRDNRSAICQALSDDFGHRSLDHGLLTEIVSPITSIKHAKKHLRTWMKPEHRRQPLFDTLLGTKASVHYQALGTVGVIAPWNFPVHLVVAPLVGILAAGNRAMLKPSEFTPRVSALLAELFDRYFNPAEVAVFVGEAEVSARFSELAFDHLVFTGGGSVAKHVMSAAAKNLVPVTLELGGKTPVVIGCDADIKKAATRIMDFKLSNAGQICISPDYLMVPEEQLGEVVDAIQAAAKQLFPSLLNNPDYSSVINQRHFERLQRYVDDAICAGVKIVEINPANEDFTDQPYYKMAPKLVINPDDECLIMQDEIFGPLLPIKTYRHIDEVVNYINYHDRPLAMYYFGTPKGADAKKLLAYTVSGGVSINDVAAHAGCESLPFGGIGPSGMGAYHGFDGFKNFSHARSVYRQGKVNMVELFGLRPPYGNKFRAAINKMMK